MNTWVRLTSIMLVLLFATTVGYSQTTGIAKASGSFSLQGQLTNTSGTAIADGQHTIAVSVYQADSTSPIYTETDMTTTTNGIFSIMVGMGNASQKLMLSSGVSYSVGIAVDGQAQLQPLITLGSSPSAIVANVADTAATALMADTASTALNAKTIGGFTASVNGGANTIPVLNAQGQLSSSLLDSSVVLSVNGQKGNVSITGGGNLSVTNSGNQIQLSFNGSSGSLNFPFSQSLDLSSGTGFSITNSLAGTAGSFINSGSGTALQVSASNGSALTAIGSSITPAVNVSNSNGLGLSAASSTTSAIMASTSATSSAALELKNTATSGAQQLLMAVNGAGTTVANLSNTGLLLDGSASGSGNAVLTLQNSASSTPGNLISALNASDSSIFSLGTNGAISATGSNASGAILSLKNMATDSVGGLISASNAAGTGVFMVGTNGATTINATADTALTLATSANGGVALKATASATGATAARLTGGLSLVGPVGTATLSAGNLTQTISNAYANANSIIILTINSALSGLTSGIRITGQAAGSFTVGLLSALSLTSDLSFNYIIINQ